ncbi:salicylaldehyde dehydrogenase, partial [Aureobasidium melanogenum]
MIPLIINGEDYVAESKARVALVDGIESFQGADKKACELALQSCDTAYKTWSQTKLRSRRQLLLDLSSLLSARGQEIKQIIKEEIHCDDLWTEINLHDTLGMIEETAALLTAEGINGSIPSTNIPDAHALVYNEPLGVVLGIAPWNSPLILGMRAVIAPVATGNTAILKGSELSPRTHYFIAKLFQDAGFPPGVVNFLLHRPEDAIEVFDYIIEHPLIRKCNFTGSTAVGRYIAQKAGAALTPVLLELGGKNCAIVLKDADIVKATDGIMLGAFLNGGQICMSTDTVVVVKDVAVELEQSLSRAVGSIDSSGFRVISDRSHTKIVELLEDARARGASIVQPGQDASKKPPNTHLPSLVIGLTSKMRYFHEESFGPLLGLVIVENELEAERIVHSLGYGLSSAIWSKDVHGALSLARRIPVGAVHVNAPTVHDEQTLPHGGFGLSGFGRFGGTWGLREFTQTKTVILHP